MGDGQLDHNILKLNVIVILSLRKLFEDKAWYSIKKKRDCSDHDQGIFRSLVPLYCWSESLGAERPHSCTEYGTLSYGMK